MTNHMAMNAMLNGLKISRSGFYDDEYIHIVDGKIVTETGMDYTESFNSFNDGWILYLLDFVNGMKDLKSFIVTYRSNYGLCVLVINADTIENARKVASFKMGEYSLNFPPHYDIEELRSQVPGCVFDECS